MKLISDAITNAIKDNYGLEQDFELTRPEPQFGDLSCNVALQLSKQLGKNPREIGQLIADAVALVDGVKSVELAGPGFVNIRLTDTALVESLSQLPDLVRRSQTIVIETNNPNPFKAMHIGHALNSITADAIANLLDASGATVNRVSYHGDVGLHVGKSMWALLKYVDGDVTKLTDVPATEHNSFMSRMYAEGSQAYKTDETAKSEIDELARQSFERTDPLYAQVYDIVFNWSFDELDRILRRIGNRPTVMRFLESQSDVRGVKVVRDNVPEVFQESDGGALVFRGSEHGSFDNVFVASSGLGLYAARDLGLMQLKNEQFHPDKSYIVTADEQRAYFKGVIAAAGKCLPELKDQTIHITTGQVKLTTGKMSSRSGEVVEISWLFDKVAEAITDRGGTATDEIVAGALRYQFLRVKIGSDIVFDVNDAVSLQGNSGPYLQYAHARACSIIAKAGQSDLDIRTAEFDDSERMLLRKMSQYVEVVNRATSELLPHHICSYLYELAQEFNRFYEKCRIIGDEREDIRLSLVVNYRDILARGLMILGIVAPDKM